MPNFESEQRFDWINGFITSALDATLASCQVSRTSSTTFRHANNKYIAYVLGQMAGVTTFPNMYMKSVEAEYLFHLESELWGTDCGHYISFLQPRTQMTHEVLQTFLLSTAFILIERWLHSAFLSPTQRREEERQDERPGRSGKRRMLFGKDVGLFTVKNKECFAALGPPFCLIGSTAKVSHVLPNSNAWINLTGIPINENMKKFYWAVARKNSFCSIIEAAFKRSRRKLPRRIYPPPKHIKRKETLGLKATWYDALWIYSESIRYHSMSPSTFSLNRPYYWNRSTR